MKTYLFIYFAEMLVVTLMTMRVVFVTKGMRKISVLISLVEVSLWALTVGSALGNIADDPWIALAYSLGFATGSYLGSYIEEFLGIGELEVKIIVEDTIAQDVGDILRESGFGVTLLQAKGKDNHKQVIIVFILRKKEKKLRALVLENFPKVVIVSHNIKPIYGGYF